VVHVPSPDGVWYLESGGGSHMTGCRDMFSTLDKTVHSMVRFGDGSIIRIQGRDTVIFECLTGNHRVLGDVYFIPSLHNNIVSLGQLDQLQDHGHRRRHVHPRQATQDPRARHTYRQPALHRAGQDCVTDEPPGTEGRRGVVVARALRHLHIHAPHTLAHKGLVRGMPSVEHVEEFCDGCAIGKQHRTPLPRATAFRAEKPLKLVHMELCGLITPPTADGKKYFLLLVDDHSCYMWLELIKTKDEALCFFKKVKALAETEHGSELLAFRSDHGGEFNSTEFSEFCKENGVKHFTCCYVFSEKRTVSIQLDPTCRWRRPRLGRLWLRLAGYSACLPLTSVWTQTWM
jgi:hypothetical protein